MTEDKAKQSEAEKPEKLDEISSETLGTPTDAAEAASFGKKDKKAEKSLKDENKKLTAALKQAEDALQKAQAELAEANDKFLRTAAEYDNFRKRSAKEREGVYSDAYADALSAFLPIMDNLERAAVYSDGAQLADGIKLIFKSAKDAFDRMGISEYGAPGEKFDPQIHNAMMHIEDDSFGENEITEVFQKGYRKGDKILREALVKVAN